MMLDSLGAIEGRDIPFLNFYDCTGGSFGKIMNVLEYGQELISANKAGSPTPERTLTVLVSFPGFWRMLLDMSV